MKLYWQKIVVDRQIVCITIKSPPVDCTCIEYVGTIDSENLIPIPKVVKLIESSKDRFYLIDSKDQSKVYVNIAQRGGLKYIRTEPTDTPDDNLLKIGYCNVARKLQGMLDPFGL